MALPGRITSGGMLRLGWAGEGKAHRAGYKRHRDFSAQRSGELAVLEMMGLAGSNPAAASYTHKSNRPYLP